MVEISDILISELKNNFPKITEKSLEIYKKENLYCPPFAIAWAFTELRTWKKVREAVKKSKELNLPFCTVVRMLQKES